VAVSLLMMRGADAQKRGGTWRPRKGYMWTDTDGSQLKYIIKIYYLKYFE
jgi:hypothetical protein